MGLHKHISKHKSKGHHFGLKSKHTSKNFSKVSHKVGSGTKKIGGGAKKGIGKIGGFAQKGLSKITGPLKNLLGFPITLMLCLGLGAFIVLKVAK